MRISLPEPRRQGGMPLMDALACRKSIRAFQNGAGIDSKTLADLLWAAFGASRPGRRTAPSSHNKQETSLYVCKSDGVWLYLPLENALEQISDKDVRGLTGTQEFVADAALNIALVADKSLITHKTGVGVTQTIFVDSGFISQNIYLYCASAGLGCVARALFEPEKVAAALGLGPEQETTLICSVGPLAPR